MGRLDFDNRYLRELPASLHALVEPAPAPEPRLLAHSSEMARRLGFDEATLADPLFSQVFGGNALLPGMAPFATAYGGHQFGNWAGLLGDGRAISLGELVTASGERWELQLKGAGRTPYSRHGDGRAVLRSSVREFLCSEAMHHLGIPSTRALSLVGTGEPVVRDMLYDGHPRAEPGAIVCRVAPSFIRFGHFEWPASRGDTGTLRRLLDFTIERDFPHLAARGAQRDAAWFAEVCERTALLMAQWMRVGFVHGVMNTDNMSVLGLTLDYGPYGWIEPFDPDWTPNTTDAHGRRYRFAAQPKVAYWNLGRLAAAVSPLFDSAEPLQDGLRHYADTFAGADAGHLVNKLGLAAWQRDDATWVRELFRLLHQAQLDMTLFFRELGETPLEQLVARRFAALSYDAEAFDASIEDLGAWLASYARRITHDALPADERLQRMRLANPRYVLRNYLAQMAIDRAEQGDMQGVHDLLEVMRHPYEDQPGREDFAQMRPDWARHRPGCSVLSCSS